MLTITEFTRRTKDHHHSLAIDHMDIQYHINIKDLKSPLMLPFAIDSFCREHCEGHRVL